MPLIQIREPGFVSLSHRPLNVHQATSVTHRFRVTHQLPRTYIDRATGVAKDETGYGRPGIVRINRQIVAISGTCLRTGMQTRLPNALQNPRGHRRSFGTGLDTPKLPVQLTPGPSRTTQDTMGRDLESASPLGVQDQVSFRARERLRRSLRICRRQTRGDLTFVDRAATRRNREMPNGRRRAPAARLSSITFSWATPRISPR